MGLLSIWSILEVLAIPGEIEFLPPLEEYFLIFKIFWGDAARKDFPPMSLAMDWEVCCSLDFYNKTQIYLFQE